MSEKVYCSHCNLSFGKEEPRGKLGNNTYHLDCITKMRASGTRPRIAGITEAKREEMEVVPLPERKYE